MKKLAVFFRAAAAVIAVLILFSAVTAFAAKKAVWVLLGRKVMTNLDSIFKNRDITLPTKVRLVKAMVFKAVMHGCDSWTIKKAEHQRRCF